MMHIMLDLSRAAEKCRNRKTAKLTPQHISYDEWLTTVETLIWNTSEGYAYDMDWMLPMAQDLWKQGFTIPNAVKELLSVWQGFIDYKTVLH